MRQFLPFFPGLSAIEPEFSADGKWMAYISFPDLTLWRSRIDGSERKQLTFAPIKVIWPRISPDGTQIAFSSVGYSSYVVNTSGGDPRRLPNSRMSQNGLPTERTSYPLLKKGFG
jgi:Tol biopolymer transport system component